MKVLKVFEYVVVYAPVDSGGEETETPQIVKTGQILARDEQKAVMSIAREVPEKFATKMDFVNLMVRPF